MIYLARTLDPSKFGELALLITLASIFTTLQDLGTSPIVIREIASKKFDPNKTLFTVLAIKIFTGIFFFTSFFFIINLLGYSEFIGNLSCVFAGGFIGESFLLSLVKYFEGKEKMQISSTLIIAERLIISIIILLLSSNLDLIKSYAVGYVISNCLVFVIGFSYALKNSKFSSKLDYYFVRELLLLSYPFIIYNIFSIIYFRLDVFVISNFFQEALVGTYRASYQLVDSLYFISLSLSISILPFFSRKFREDIELLKKSYAFLTKEIIYFGIYLSILIFLNSEQIIQILYKGKYLVGSSSLAILSLTLPLFFGSNVMGNLLISIGKEKFQISSMILSTIIKVLLLIFFIREFGILGAAISCLIAEMFSFLIQFYGTRTNNFAIKFSQSDVVRIILIAFSILVGLILHDVFLHGLIILVILLYSSRNNLQLLINTIKNR